MTQKILHSLFTKKKLPNVTLWPQQLRVMLPLLLPRLLPELSSALLCFTGEVSGDVRILSRDRGGAPQAGVFCNKRAL